MNIFMIYTILLTHFQIWSYIRYLVWLIIQIIVLNGFYVLSQLTMLVIFHFKVIIYWNFNLPRTYGQCFENENYQTFHMVHKHDSKYVNHMWNKY
jgi:hypothetical protein